MRSFLIKFQPFEHFELHWTPNCPSNVSNEQMFFECVSVRSACKLGERVADLNVSQWNIADCHRVTEISSETLIWASQRHHRASLTSASSSTITCRTSSESPAVIQPWSSPPNSLVKLVHQDCSQFHWLVFLVLRPTLFSKQSPKFNLQFASKLEVRG